MIARLDARCRLSVEGREITPLAVLKLVKKEWHRSAMPDWPDESHTAYQGLKALIDWYEKAEAVNAHCVFGDASDLRDPESVLPVIRVTSENVRKILKEHGFDRLSEECDEPYIVDLLRYELPRVLEIAKRIELETAQMVVDPNELDWPEPAEATSTPNTRAQADQA